MIKVGIIDAALLFGGGINSPNPEIMQFASYIRQKKYQASLILNILEIDMDFDRIFIIASDNVKLNIPQKLFKDKRIFFIGQQFKYYKNHKEMPVYVYMCRPDYDIYFNYKFKTEDKSHYVTYFHKGTLLKKRQNFLNVKSGKRKLIVTDYNLWEQDFNDILWVIKDLQKYKNIQFKKAIPLSLLSNKKFAKEFLKLKFCNKNRIEFNNDIDSSYNSLLNLFDTFNTFRMSNRSLKTSELYVDMNLTNLNNTSDLEKDFERIMSIIDLYKNILTIRIFDKDPERYKIFKDIFYELDLWRRNKNYKNKDFITFMLWSDIQKYKNKNLIEIIHSNYKLSRRGELLLEFLLNKNTRKTIKEYVPIGIYRKINFNIIK